MIKWLVINIFFLLSASIAIAQQSDTLLLKLSKTGKDTNRVNLQLQLSSYYSHKNGANKHDFDSTLYYIRAAEALSISTQAIDHQYRCLLFKGELYLKNQDFDSADKLFTKVTDHYHSIGDQIKEAKAWDKYADLIRYDDVPHLNLRSRCVNKSYEIYKSMPDKLKASQALGRVADVDLNLGLYDKAEKELLSVIAQSKALHYPKQYYAYYLLAETYNRNSELQKSLMARIECVKSYEKYPLHTIDDGMLYYYALGTAYSQNKFYEPALTYYQKAMDISIKLGSRQIYYLSMGGIVSVYTKLKRYKLALTELRKFSDRYKSKTPQEESLILFAQMTLYNLLHDVNHGEKIIPAFKKVNNKLYQEIEKESNYYTVDYFIKNYEPLLQHYIITQQWGKCAKELQKLESLSTKRVSVPFKLLLFKIRFKLDSATGNSLAALKKFQQIKIIEDSITTLANTKQINELEARFESEKKDKTIQNLNNQSTIQKSKLEKINLQRNITFAGILVAIILVALLYIAYRNKQRSNFRLQLKQDQINRQNNELSALVKEEKKLLTDKDILLKQQEGLITEKEWLLREVHHRVKNNLQIVMSLLYTQAAYSQNSDAINAISDSRNRVQAISIIHQKLYSKSNVSTIIMSEYVADIIRHLSDFYDCARRRIRFRDMVEPVNLDSSQAVPLGLILNEAITNSIKYAFGADGGEIVIESNLIDGETICLKIADNGRGLPPDFDLSKTSSLGMEMMRALSKQIGGSFEIHKDSGVVISIKFKVDHSLKPIERKLVTT